MRRTIKAILEREGWTGAAGRRELQGLKHISEVIQETGRYVSEEGLFDHLGVPTEKVAMYRSGNMPWTVAMEAAFREIKRLVYGAVDLFVMDVIGAQTNI